MIKMKMRDFPEIYYDVDVGVPVKGYVNAFGFLNADGQVTITTIRIRLCRADDEDSKIQGFINIDGGAEANEA